MLDGVKLYSLGSVLVNNDPRGTRVRDLILSKLGWKAGKVAEVTYIDISAPDEMGGCPVQAKQEDCLLLCSYESRKSYSYRAGRTTDL